ncbi:replicative helicase loader/inhibitor [Paenibacillus sp. FSL M8-0228]|uniref:replicative helicase loader/inhibitor n=1 Tax=Paenibacillus sp. FSL M8-0228 TaxID=2921620 RepID=UPI0030FA37A5
MEKREAIDIVKKTAAYFPSWKIDKSVVDIWVDKLQQYDFETVMANLTDYLSLGKDFAPGIPTLIKANERIEANKEIERTREMIRRQDEERKDIPKDPPWVREGITRQAWMQRLLAEKRAEAQ